MRRDSTGSNLVSANSYAIYKYKDKHNDCKKGSFEKKYDIFMAISENCGHDARGNTVPGCDFEDIVTSYKKWIIKK